MCISNTKAEMTGTKILVAPVVEGDSCRQLTVYTNEMELAKTKRELAEVKMERDILKKAAAYFAKESLPGTR